MGSDLSYEDLSNRELNENQYKLIREEKIDSLDCYVLEIIPNENLRSEYQKHITWITKDNFLAIKEESYDKSGGLLKQKTFKFQEIKNYHTPVEIFVKNVQKNHQTLLTFENLVLDSGVEDKLFQEKNLKRIPK